MSQTALDIINSAMAKIGAIAIGETLSADEAIDCFQDLNDVLDIFNINRLNIYHTKDFTGTFVGGQQSYTIGIGQQFNTTRPTFIQNIYQIYNTVSYPIIEVTNNQFDAIPLKNIQTAYPEVFYYETSYPYGILHFWPIPTENSPVVISYDDQFSQLSTLNQVVSLPPGYSLLIKMELALLLSTKTGVDYGAENYKILAEARNAVKTNNHVPNYTKNDPLAERSNRADYTFIFTGGFL